MDTTIIWMILAIVAGSLISLVGGILLLRVKKRRNLALLLALPFAAGALLAAAFLDLLPEALEMHDAHEILIWTLIGFTAFFLLERLSTWFHSHHDHHDLDRKHTHKSSQRTLIVLGDVAHNAIDGLAIGAAFLVSIPTGIITTIAVAAHEIPKELGTFAFLLSRGWRGRVVILANLLTAIATIIAAVIVYSVGSVADSFVAPLIAATAGFFIYVAASDIIPDIHEQPKRIGTIQAGMLVLGIAVVAIAVELLHGAHSH